MLLAASLGACVGVGVHDLRKAEDSRAADSKVLKGALSSSDSSIRLASTRAMGRIQEPGYFSPLLTALRDPDPAVRSEAAFALGQLRIDDSSSPPAGLTEGLAAALSDPAAAVRASAIEALGKSGGPGAEEYLRERLSDSDAESRREAATALFRLRYLTRIADYSSATVTALTGVFGDPDPEVRWLAVYAFSRWPEPGAAERLAQAARDSGVWTRLFALRALAQLGKDAPIDVARGALADPDERVRAEAVALLGKTGRADALGVKILEDPSAHVRAAAAAALDGPNGPLFILEPLASDPSVMVRAVALKSLAKRKRDWFITGIKKHAEDPHWWVRSAALAAAAEIHKDAHPIDQAKLEPVLMSGYSDPDVRVRAAALEALASLGRADMLAAALRDPAAPIEVRGTAIEAVAKDPSTELFEPLKTAWENSSAREFVELRESIVDAAAALAKSTPVVAGLSEFRERMLLDPAPSVRVKAAKALGKDPGPLPVPEPSPFLQHGRPRENELLLETNKGDIIIELFHDAAPIHCANIVSLAKKGVYDGTPWHRVVINFVIQGGDPRGSGWGDAGYSIRDEINRQRHRRGAIGMPKAGKDTGGAQLFITHVPTPHLDGRYTVFGRVVRGIETVDLIEPGDVIRKATAR